MSKRLTNKLKVVLLLGLGFLCGTSYVRPAHGVEQPNIVFVMIDDLGPEWVSCYGAEDIETPFIDELAATGMKFLNAYSMPQCTPTRATLLTGEYPFRHGWVNHWDVPRWGAGCHFDQKYNVTFARQLKSVGYTTGIAGKWQINDFRVQPNVLKEHGFVEWCMWTGFESQNPPSAERYWDPFVFQNVTGPGYDGPSSNIRPSQADISDVERTGQERQPATKRLIDGKAVGLGVAGTYEGQFGPDVYNAFCCDFVQRHRDGPFLLYYPMCLTHGPFVHTPDEPTVTGKLAQHKAMVRYTDTLIGRLVAAIDTAGVRERTILIVTTDNGTSVGITGHMNGCAVRGGKGRVTENGVRQPFIVSCPGTVPEGVETECLTDFSDLLPTFCELAGAPLPQDVVIDGKSIAPVILGKVEDGPREWIMAMGHGPARQDEQGVRPVEDFTHRVIRDKRFKIHVSDDREITALYDLRDDPAEEENLIKSPLQVHQDAIKRLTAALESMPRQDDRPRYDPTPPQRWDLQRQ
ncbi:MAG: sulfatase-like hydrolase/transferase [Planctomycetaceae bacterium]|nr:sulfatase-like hydrolase/transferase [Planctomycetaceae bacterium]